MSTNRTSDHSLGLRIVGNNLEPRTPPASIHYTPYIAVRNQFTVSEALPSYSALPHDIFVVIKDPKNKRTRLKLA